MKMPKGIRFFSTEDSNIDVLCAVRNAYGPVPVLDKDGEYVFIFFNGDEDAASMILQEEGNFNVVGFLSVRELAELIH